MKTVRKICINQSEIEGAKNFNQQIAYQYADSFTQPKLMNVPQPIFREYEWNVRMGHINNFYVEGEAPEASVDKEKQEALENAPDIILNVLYEGIVRVRYNPLLHLKLDTLFSTFE